MRTYRTGEALSLPYGRRMVKGPKRDWHGKSDWKPRSRPARPKFCKPRRDGRNDFFTANWWLEYRRPRWTAENVRKDREWLKEYGFRRKLRNAANSTRIRHKVANRRSHTN